MLSENTKSNFKVSVGRYASISVNRTGVNQDVIVINYRHTEQDLDQIASQVFNQLVNLNDATLNHFIPLLQVDPYRVDLTIYPGGIGTEETKYLFDFEIHGREIYRVEITNEDLKSERMLRRTLETILYAMLFRFKPTRIVEKEHDRSPEFEKLQDRLQRERGHGRSYDFARQHGHHELTRGR